MCIRDRYKAGHVSIMCAFQMIRCTEQDQRKRSLSVFLGGAALGVLIAPFIAGRIGRRSTLLAFGMGMGVTCFLTVLPLIYRMLL